MREGVRWLREHADDFGVDEDAISAAGYSAGGVLALLLASLPLTAPAPGNSNWPTRIAAAVSVAGTALPWMPQPGEPPSFFAHGDRDPRVPYSSAVETCDAVLAAGIRCELFTMVGAQHDPSAFEPEVRERAAAFLFSEVLEPRGYTTAVGPPPTGPTTPTTTTPTSTPPTSTPDPARGLAGDRLAAATQGRPSPWS